MKIPFVNLISEVLLNMYSSYADYFIVHIMGIEQL